MKKIIFGLFIYFLLWTFSYSYDKIQFQGQTTHSSLIRPSAIAVSDDLLFVADTKLNTVFIFDKNQNMVAKTSVKLNSPMALCYGDKKIYVSDTNNSRIVVFNTDGNFLWSFSGLGLLPGQLNRPQGISYGPDDKIFVANTGNSRVEIFNKDGIFLYGFDTLKSDKVSKIKPAKIRVDISGNIYVSDAGGEIIQKLDRNGKLLKEFSYANDGFYVDEYGFIYIINSKEGKVRELFADGEVLGTFGTRGKGKTEFEKLADVTMDSQENIYLCDEGNKKITSIRLENKLKTKKLAVLESFDKFALKGPVKTYNYKAESFLVLPDFSIIAFLPDSKELALIDESGKKTISRFGGNQGQVKQVKSFALAKNGNFFVSDTGNNRIQIFDSKGTFVNLFGEKGSREGRFNSPQGIVINSNERVYVADSKNKRVQAFNQDGIFLFAFGPQIGSIMLENPVSLEVDALDNVYVLDSVLKKIIVTDSSGKFLKTWSDFPEYKQPAVLESDEKGYFFVLDRESFSIKIFDADGKYIMSFFAKGTGERELNQPHDIKIVKNKLYISDSGNSKILVFDLTYIPDVKEAPFKLPQIQSGPDEEQEKPDSESEEDSEQKTNQEPPENETDDTQ